MLPSYLRYTIHDVNELFHLLKFFYFNEPYLHDYLYKNKIIVS